MAARPDLVSSGIGGMGTICYPNGESFEGEVMRIWVAAHSIWNVFAV